MDKTAAELTEAARERIKPKNFALPKQEKYPIHDLPHARNALARASQHASPGQEATIRSKVYSKFPGLAERAKEASVKIAQMGEGDVKRRFKGGWSLPQAATVGAMLPTFGLLGAASGTPTIQGRAMLGRVRKGGENLTESEAAAMKAHPELRRASEMGQGREKTYPISRFMTHWLPATVGGAGVGGALGSLTGSDVGSLLGAIAGGAGGAGLSYGLRKMHAGQVSRRADQAKQASVELPEEVEKMAAAIALGTTLADEDLMGLKKEAMEIASRMMVKGAQSSFWDQVAGMGSNYAAGAPSFQRGDVSPTVTTPGLAGVRPAWGLGTGEAGGPGGEWSSQQFYPDVLPAQGELVAGVTPEARRDVWQFGSSPPGTPFTPTPGDQPITGNLATLLGGGPPAEMVAGTGPGPVSEAADLAKADLANPNAEKTVAGPVGAGASPTLSFVPGMPNDSIQITPGAGVQQLTADEIAALPPGATGVSPTLGVPVRGSRSYAPPKGGEETATDGGLTQTGALHAALNRERAFALHVMEKAGSLEKRALTMGDIGSWAGARGQEAKSTAQTILDWAKSNPEAAGAIAGGAGGAGVGALAAGKGKRGKGALLGGTLGGLGGLVAGHTLGRPQGGAAPKAPAAAAPPGAPKPSAAFTPAGPAVSPEAQYEQIARRAEQAGAGRQAEAARAYEEIARRSEAAAAARQAQNAAAYSQMGERMQQAGRASRTLQEQRELGAQLAQFLASQGR